jgi:hypothetical protein
MVASIVQGHFRGHIPFWQSCLARPYIRLSGLCLVTDFLSRVIYGDNL